MELFLYFWKINGHSNNALDSFLLRRVDDSSERVYNKRETVDQMEWNFYTCCCLQQFHFVSSSLLAVFSVQCTDKILIWVVWSMDHKVGQQQNNQPDNLRTKATDEYDSQYFLKHNEIALYLHYEAEQGKESFL